MQRPLDDDLLSLARAARALFGLATYGSSRAHGALGDRAIHPLLETTYDRAVLRIRGAAAVDDEGVDRVKTALVSEMSKRKFRVATSSGQDIAFEQPASSTALQGLLSTAVRGNPTERVTYAIVPENENMHVTANIVLVRKLAAMEQETDINQGPEGQAVQAILDKIASDVAAPKTSKAEN